MKLRRQAGPKGGLVHQFQHFRKGALRPTMITVLTPDHPVLASSIWLPSCQLNHSSDSTFVNNNKCESKDSKKNAVATSKGAMDGSESG